MNDISQETDSNCLARPYPADYLFGELVWGHSMAAAPSW